MFTECDDVIVFDALDPSMWKKIEPDSLVLFYRIEREFSTKEWQQIFTFMHRAGVRKVLIAVPLYLTLLGYVLSVVRRTKHFVKGESLSFVGYWRSEKSFEYLWRSLYTGKKIMIGNWHSFLLERIEK